MEKDIKVEDVTTEVARKQLPQWLISAAILQKHRGMESSVKHLDALIMKAYKLLGEEEYDKIFKNTVSEFA